MPRGPKVAIITGGGQGIGLACVRRFARDGYKVVIADINDKAGTGAAEELKTNGWDGLFVHCDIGNRLHVHNLMAATLDAYNRVDVLINNAAITSSADFLEIEEADFDRIMLVNLKGAFLTSQAVAKQMVAQLAEEKAKPDVEASRSYSIVNMSSVNAMVANADQLCYSVSKGAVNQLTRAMALALARHGIRVNAIGPGSINTDLMKAVVLDSQARRGVLDRTPLGRIGEATEIASIAAFLASDDASYVTGQCIFADGGRLALNHTMHDSGPIE